MAILHSCCFWKSVRKGSYASALYTMVYFGISCVIVSVYLYEEQQYLSGELEKPIGESFLEKEAISPPTVIFNILLVICATCGVISSILVIIGLRKNKREFLVPWILCMIVDSTIECAHFIYLIVKETLEFEPLTAIIFTMDFFIMFLNIYCLLCVISQYQEYKAGRGYARHDSQENARYTPPPLMPVSTNGSVAGNVRRQFQRNSSSLMYPLTNFSIIPEETQINGESSGDSSSTANRNNHDNNNRNKNSKCAVSNLSRKGKMIASSPGFTYPSQQSKRCLNILTKKNKHVQFPEEKMFKLCTGSGKSILGGNSSDNGRILIETQQGELHGNIPERTKTAPRPAKKISQLKRAHRTIPKGNFFRVNRPKNSCA